MTHGILRSLYRPPVGKARGRFDVHVELLDATFEPGDRLGMCTGTPMGSTEASSALIHEQTSTRIVLLPESPAAIEGEQDWTITELEPAYPAIHANQGPLSAWIERADGTTFDLDVLPAELDQAPPAPADLKRTAERVSGGVFGLVPRPAEMTSDGLLRHGLGVTAPTDPDDRWPAVEALASRLGVDVTGARRRLVLDPVIDSALPPRSYDLAIDSEVAHLRGASPEALTHGMVTLAQLVAAGVPERVHIVDAPQYSHRGLSIDLARRWFEPDVVERLIDLAAWRKLSHLQLHLTDDEAWRVPVDAYPALGEVGGVRGHGLAIGPLCGSGSEPYGRAYTRSEIRRWVERARDLGIELVPEIDIPGHCHAAIIAVPDLKDPEDRSHAASVQGFRDNVLVPGPETTRFLHEVFGTLSDLFPASSVLHVGGDEVPANAWVRSPRAAAYGRQHGIEPGPALAGALIGDAVAAIHAAGRGWAGWQEVARFDHVIEPSYVVAWTSASAVAEVLARGMRVVASPSNAYYLDMAVDDGWSTPGASWAGSTPMAVTCDLDLSSLDTTGGRLIGGQAAMWCEYVSSLEVLDELLFPRLDAVAEATWTGDTTGRADDISGRSTRLPTVLRQAAMAGAEASGD